MNRWRRVARFAIFQSFCLSLLIVSRGSAEPPAFRLPPVGLACEAYKSLDAVEIVGSRTIPPSVVRSKLAQLPGIVEAMHPSIGEATFRQRVRDAVARGFLASGFLDRRITVNESQSGENDEGAGRYELMVDEGARYRRGKIQVTGASHPSNAFVEMTLSNLATNEEKPKPFWLPSKVFNGSLIAKLGLEDRIREELNQIGLDGKAAGIQFVRDDHASLVELHVQLVKDDATLQPKDPAEVSGSTQVDPVVDPTADPIPDAPQRIDDELQQVYQQNFAKPLVGAIIHHRKRNGTASIGWGRDSAWGHFVWPPQATIGRREQSIALLMENDVILVAADSSAVDKGQEQDSATWRLPCIDFGIVLTQKAIAETQGSNSLSVQFDWHASTDSKERKTFPSGFRFSPLGWQEWFPAESTVVRSYDGGRQFVFGSHQLTVNQAGELVYLQGTTADGSILEIERATDAEIRAGCPAIIDAQNPQDIVVRDPATGGEIALTQIVGNAKAANQQDHEFYIPAANGQKSLWGVVMLMVVHQENIVQRESLIGRLATLYALELSGYDRTLRERIAEIETESLAGPMTSFLIGDLHSRIGHLEQAKQAYEQVLLLSQHDRSVRRDINLIVNESNLLGQLSQSIDLKQLLQMALRLAASDQNIDTSVIQTMLAMMPDGTEKTARRENGQLVLRFLYEAKLHKKFRELSVSRIDQVEQKQQKIAAKVKAKKKKDDQAKKAAKKKRPLR